MKFTSILAVLAAPLAVLAQTSTSSSSGSTSTGSSGSTGSSQQNPFKIPVGGLSATAGQSLTIQWTPTTSGTVSLYLREGAQSNLDPGTEIATNIANSGSYTWSVPSGTVRGSDYALEIRSSTGSNYTPPFVIESTVTVATTTSASASASSSSASASGSSSSASGSSSSASASKSSSASGSSSSASASKTSSASSTGTTSGAAFQSTSSTSNPAARATAAAGMIGLVALGALAL